MRAWIVGAMVGAWVIAWGSVGDVGAAGTQPKAVVLNPDQDAGHVKAGEVVTFEFPVRNVGKAPLQIFGAKADCGCAVPSYEKIVPPGATRPVRVTLNTHGFYGRIEKHVYVECDDPEQASLLLTVRATLPDLVQVLPSSQILLPTARGRESRTKVTLRAGDGEKIGVLQVGCDRPWVRVNVAAPGAQGQDPELEIVALADAPTEVFEATVRVRTTHSRKPWVAIQLFGQPEGTVTAQPPRIDFGHLRLDGPTPVIRLLTLSRRQGAFRVVRVETNDPALKVTVLPDATPTYCELEVAYLGGWRQQVEGKIVVYTDDPRRPQIEIPYTAEVW